MSIVVAELPRHLELTPGKIPEIDEHTRQVLASLIMDETVELPPSSRRNMIRYDGMSDEDFISLYQPLVEVLQLDPKKDRPPLRGHINRASKLGLTPSVAPIYSRMSLSEVHKGLGFRAKFRFNDWMISDFVSAGQRLARYAKGRPTRDLITAAGRGEIKRLKGDFPTVDDIKSRFGRLSVYHELIGYPSCRGWSDDDYLDWAFAFYRQNPGRDLSARIIDGFSAKGRGPSKQPIFKIFKSIAQFKDLSRREFENLGELEAQNRQLRLEDAEDLAAHDGTLLEALAESEGEKTRILQITAQYRVARGLGVMASLAEIRDASKIKSADGFVRWCINRSEGKISAATVETHASALGVFEDLWPMYRFQNVDLTLPNTAQ